MLQNSGPITLTEIGAEFQLTAPYSMSDLYGKANLPISGPLSFTSFYGKSNFQIVLVSKSFEVYTTKTTTIPIANILAGSFDEYSDGNDPLTLVSVYSAVNGTVVINGSSIEFTSTSSAGNPASFQYMVRNSMGIEKSDIVTMTVTPIPPIICVSDTFTLQQGESLILSKSELAKNDIDEAGYALTVDWVGNAVGGTVSINGDNLTFVSTGLSGQPAQFDYSVVNTIGTRQTGTVYINITPLPEQEYYLYNNSEEVSTSLHENTPPTVLDIFNTWARIDGGNYFKNKSTARGAASDWQYLTNPNRVLMPTNTSYGNGFISPDKLDNYTFEATLTSSDSDDDTIGLIIAYVRDGSVNKILAAVRTKGGMQPTHGWGLIYTENGPWDPTWVIKNINVGGVSGGFSGAKTRIKIQRQGDKITCYATNWNDIDNYQITSKIDLDLNSDPRLSVFKGPQSYGYYTHSQSNSTYLDVSFRGGLDRSKIFDATTGVYYEYNTSTQTWDKTDITIQQEIGYIRKVTNPDTNQRFIVKESSIEYLGKLTSSENFDSVKILNEEQLLILDIPTSGGASSGIQVVGLYENGKEEKNYLKGKTLYTTSSYSQYNYMSSNNWFLDNGIDIYALNFVGGIVVFSNGIVGKIDKISNGKSSSKEPAYIYYTPYTYKLYDKLI